MAGWRDIRLGLIAAPALAASAAPAADAAYEARYFRGDHMIGIALSPPPGPPEAFMMCVASKEGGEGRISIGMQIGTYPNAAAAEADKKRLATVAMSLILDGKSYAATDTQLSIDRLNRLGAIGVLSGAGDFFDRLAKTRSIAIVHGTRRYEARTSDRASLEGAVDDCFFYATGEPPV